MPGVVVDPEYVQRRIDDFLVALGDESHVADLGHVPAQVLGIAAAQQRVEEDPVTDRVHAPGGVDIGRRRRWPDRPDTG